MGTLVLALIAVRNQHRQTEKSLPEPYDFQPFDLQALRNLYKAKDTPPSRPAGKQQSYSAYRQQESVVAEPEEFQPFDLQSAEKLRENKSNRSAGGLRAANRLALRQWTQKLTCSPRHPFFLSWRDHARAPFAATIHSGDQAPCTRSIELIQDLGRRGLYGISRSPSYSREPLCSRERAVLVQTGYLENTALKWVQVPPERIVRIHATSK